MNKKLQVFVSSTYTDLIEERQAAVEAILDAGHIPAGMELFKAGNRSQLETIYKWIDESDVYMLILGGRYGSIEPNSGKSYTHLEYQYALNKNIPVFSIVLSEKMLYLKAADLGGQRVLEKDNPDLYEEFKKQVMSKTIREVNNIEGISAPIYTTLTEFISEYNLSGWVRESDSVSRAGVKSLREDSQILQEINKLIKENQRYKNSGITSNDEVLSFDEIFSILKEETYTFENDFYKIDHFYKYNGVDLFLTLYPIFSFEILKCDMDFLLGEADSCTLLDAISLFNNLDLCDLSVKADRYCFSTTNTAKIFIRKLKSSKYIISLEENSCAKNTSAKQTAQHFAKPHQLICENRFRDIEPCP